MKLVKSEFRCFIYSGIVVQQNINLLAEVNKKTVCSLLDIKAMSKCLLCGKQCAYCALADAKVRTKVMSDVNPRTKAASAAARLLINYASL